MGVTVVPATPDRWDDLAALFGPSGAYDGCWCVWWRVTSAEYRAGRGDDNRERLAALVAESPAPGLLAYDGPEAVGWVSLGPRTAFGRLRRSPLFRPDHRGEDPDDDGVWSVVCFYIRRDRRRNGLTDELLAAAVDHARDGGARAVEGYAVVPDGARAAELFPGTPGTFARAGFREVGDPSPRRRLMRLELR